jgi:putative transposase
MRLIDEEYTRHPFYGSRKLVIYLATQDYRVNRKRIQRLMRLMGIEALYPKPKTSTAHPQHKVYPYLLNQVEITYPNQVWSTDITYRAPSSWRHLGGCCQDRSMFGTHSS